MKKLWYVGNLGSGVALEDGTVVAPGEPVELADGTADALMRDHPKDWSAKPAAKKAKGGEE